MTVATRPDSPRITGTEKKTISNIKMLMDCTSAALQKFTYLNSTFGCATADVLP